MLPVWTVLYVIGLLVQVGLAWGHAAISSLPPWDLFPPGKTPGEPKSSSRKEGYLPMLFPFIVDAHSPRRIQAIVIVAPGGGFSYLEWKKEGLYIAHQLNAMGISAAVLRYRVPPHGDSTWVDTQRAIRLVRHKAPFFGLNGSQIGFIGFSAGGRLGAIAGTSFLKNSYANVDAADLLSCRPDFILSVYGLNYGSEPVTSMHPSNFLVTACDDPVLGIGYTTGYFLNLRSAGASPSELHIYRKGGHGYGWCNEWWAGDVCDWPFASKQFMSALGLLPNSTMPIIGYPGWAYPHRQAIQLYRQAKLMSSRRRGPQMFPYLVATSHPFHTRIITLVVAGASPQALGDDVANWLNSVGISAMLLGPNSTLQDLRRAMEVIHRRSKALHMSEYHLGVLGVGSGASVAARLACESNPGAGALRQIDFVLLVYPVGLPLSLEITSKHPPTLITSSWGSSENDVKAAVSYLVKLRDNKAPASELHIYAIAGTGPVLCNATQIQAATEECAWHHHARWFLHALGPVRLHPRNHSGQNQQILPLVGEAAGSEQDHSELDGEHRQLLASFALGTFSGASLGLTAVVLFCKFTGLRINQDCRDTRLETTIHE